MAKDMLEYTEEKAAKSLDVARKSYDDLHERVYKLATVLAAGAGAIGAYALGKYGTPGAMVQWAPLGMLSLSWFAAAGTLVVRGAVSRKVSPGNGPANLREYYAARLSEQSTGTDQDELNAARITREAELDLQQTRLSAYIAGCNARANAVDATYKAVALSPIAPLVTIAVLGLLGTL